MIVKMNCSAHLNILNILHTAGPSGPDDPAGPGFPFMNKSEFSNLTNFQVFGIAMGTPFAVTVPDALIYVSSQEGYLTIIRRRRSEYW